MGAIDMGKTLACAIRMGRIHFHISLLHLPGLRMEYKTWMCVVCGFIYDESSGRPDEGIAPGTRWQEVPVNWTCPECGARKDDFEMLAI
jgi:rubredoxin